jgi:hypothetical protein
VNVAVTVVALVTVTVHGPVPLHPPPLQPVNSEPTAGPAVSVTTVPLIKLALQVAPQLIPAGLLVTVPVPAPASVTLSMCVGLKVAVTVLSVLMVTLHVVPDALSQPLQLLKAFPPAVEAAVSVTAVPLS